MSKKVLSIIFLLTMLVFIRCELEGNFTNECPNFKTDFGNIRKRRHLAFPDNSFFVVTVSLVKGFLTHVPSGWNTVLEIETLFPLPDHKFTSRSYRRKLHHRQKRDFWERIQNAIDFHNWNGKACILRSICEAKYHLAPPGRSLVHDVLRAIFTAPIHEEGFTQEMADLYDEFDDPEFCDKVQDCPVSLLHFILDFNKQKY